MVCDSSKNLKEWSCRGRIRLKGMSFYGLHGVSPEERRLPHPFEVDVELSLDLQRAGETDHLDATVDYGVIFQRVQDIVSGPAQFLIEHVAYLITQDLMTLFPAAEATTVRVRKMAPPLAGTLQYAEVEMCYERP